MRQIILDTETTGLEVSLGHRVIEIAAIEMINRQKTGKFLHFYLNPERVIEESAIRVHGITNEFLKDKPKFKNVAEEILNFIKDSELLIHNASFDLGFLNKEFSLWDEKWAGIDPYCTVVDTLVMARAKHRGARNSLDALCKRYKVNSAHRTFHGALLDSELLAEVYLAMTGGQINLWAEEDSKDSAEKTLNPEELKFSGSLNGSLHRVIHANEEETVAHQAYLKALEKPSGGKVLWNKCY
jgi:DNA polymerase III subunit epsilon